jgi:hypothetical protein
MTTRRKYHAFFTLLDGRAVAAGTGDAILEPSFSSEAYDPSTNTWASLGSTAQRIDTYGLSGVGIMKGSRAGYGLIIGAGWTNLAGGMLNPTTNTWAATPIPSVSFDQSTLVLLSDGATVLAVPGLHANAHKFDSTAGTATTPGAWTATATMKAVRLDHAAVLLPNGNVAAPWSPRPSRRPARSGPRPRPAPRPRPRLRPPRRPRFAMRGRWSPSCTGSDGSPRGSIACTPSCAEAPATRSPRAAR